MARLIDVNTRFYGSLALALAAGVNLPAAWHAVALEQPAEHPSPTVGASYRWVEADLMAATRGMRGRLSTAARARAPVRCGRDDLIASAVFAAGAVGGGIRRRLRRRA